MLNKAFNESLSNKLIASTNPGKVLKYSAKLDSSLATGVYYIQAWDADDVPAGATVVTNTNSVFAPVEVAHTNGTATILDVDLTGPEGEAGLYFKDGFVLALSTTEFSYTAGTNHMAAVALWEAH